jgi:hypothetical protein
MNFIDKIIKYFSAPAYEKLEEKRKQDREAEIKKFKEDCCKYTENPFSTDFRNYMQRIKAKESCTGWGVKSLSSEEVKKRLDAGICFLDYPVLDENGVEIEGVKAYKL